MCAWVFICWCVCTGVSWSRNLMASPEKNAAQRWRKCVDTVLCDLTEDQLKSIKNNSGETNHLQ